MQRSACARSDRIVKPDVVQRPPPCPGSSRERSKEPVEPSWTPLAQGICIDRTISNEGPRAVVAVSPPFQGVEPTVHQCANNLAASHARQGASTDECISSRRHQALSFRQEQRALMPATAAVELRRMVVPSVTPIQPEARAWATSRSLQPPSGPIASQICSAGPAA